MIPENCFRKLLVRLLFITGLYLPAAGALGQLPQLAVDTQPRPPHLICYFSNTNPVSVPTEGITDFDQWDPIFTYMDSLRIVLGQVSRKNLLKRTVNSMAYSTMDNEYRNMIVINRSYFENRYFDPEEKRAAVYFVLGHEYAHAYHQDLTCLDENSRCLNYIRELQADQRAGYALAKLCHVGIHFIEDLLRRYLSTDSFSMSHPDVSYRILAAEGGWLEGVTERLAFGEKISIQGRSFVKLPGTDQQILVGEVDAAGRRIGVWTRIALDRDLLDCSSMNSGIYPGKAVRIYKERTELSLYLGQQMDSRRSGYGLFLYSSNAWFRGIWAADQRRRGEFHEADGGWYNGEYYNDQMEGMGRYEYPDGRVYSGDWKAGKHDGRGILWQPHGASLNGWWKEDVFQGVINNSGNL
jgi:hypothetical protein